MKKGSRHSKASRDLMSLQRRGSKHHMFGKHFSKASRERMSLAVLNNPSERLKRRKRCIARTKGKYYFKDFLDGLSRIERRLWLKENGRKVSLSYHYDPKRQEKHRIFMTGNKYRKNYLIKNPINVVPDWNRHVPFKSVPEFVPIPRIKLSVEQQTNYFCLGISPEISTGFTNG